MITEQLEIPGLESAPAVPPEILEARQRVLEDGNRQALLEVLYHLDGRNDPGHEHHSTFTGLFEKYALQVGRTLFHDAMRTSELAEVLLMAGPVSA